MPRPAWRRACLVSTAFAGVLFASDPARAACDPAAASNVTATCTGATNNQGTGAPGTSGGVNGYGLAVGLSNLTVNVLTGASVTGTDSGIRFTSGTVNNLGSVSGQFGIIAPNAAVINYGTLAGTTGDGINVTNLVLTNYGTITTTAGGFYGVVGNISTNITNSGFISGAVNGIRTVRGGSVTNSGTIIGGSGKAILFNSSGTPASDDLTVLPGARFGGLIDFGGGADRVNFGPGSWIINTANFNAGLSTITTAGSPYWVTPNQIVVADISSFGAINRAMLDITGWIASVLPDTPVFDPVTNNAANAFAAIESASPRVNEAFSNFPSALPYAPTPVFKGGSVQDTAGNAFWAKGFGGRREQDTTGDFLGSITTGYGGAIGYDRKFAGFQAGGFVGGSNNQTKLSLNAGSVDIDTTFGGGYVRAFFGASFLDVALIGGNLDTSSKRNIGGGLNRETASADYNGWYLNPIATLGHRIALGNGLTLTPALKARYLKAHFDGYTETGSTANLTVNGRDTETFEERAELSLASVQYYGGDSRILFRMAGGALAQQRQGDGNVGLSFAGQSLLAVTADQPRVNGWYGNAGFDWQVGRLAVFAAGEITDTSDSAVTYSGRGGLRMVW